MARERQTVHLPPFFAITGIRRPTVIAVAVCAPLLSLTSLSAAPAASSLEDDFSHPPVECRPHVWWHWMGSNFSIEGITKDLEAMKATGIGGATIFNITSNVNESHAPTENNPWPDQTYRSPKYWAALRHAAKEAKRLGLEIGLHNTVGYSTTGGPWIDEERSMQRLLWTETALEGDRDHQVKLPAPATRQQDGWGKTGRQFSWFNDIAVLAVPADRKTLDLKDIINLSDHMKADGTLTWKAPAGKWQVYRLAHGSTGRSPHPVPDDVLGKTLEADKLSLEQTTYHWNNVIQPIRQQLGPLVGTSFKHFLIDSYEAGNQNWTANFRADFKKLKGYDPLPWLMSMGGIVKNDKGSPERIIGSAEQTARFEWDYRDVVATLFLENSWKPAVTQAHATGMTIAHEAYGGAFDTIAGSALADTPMVEFWTGKSVTASPVIVGAARAAGRQIIAAEAFTGAPGRSKWNETPSDLKAAADGGYVTGVNRMVLHHWVHQPFDDRYQPAMGMGWWGTHFNRHQTWFEPGKDFFRYLGRVQAMLQRGETPVAHVSIGAATEGGDAISLETLMTDARVEQGKIVLGSGRRYDFLHWPHNGTALPSTLKKIESLLQAGATIVATAPQKSPSLQDFPHCDDEVRAIAQRLWGADKERVRTVGKGKLVTSGQIAEARQLLSIQSPFQWLGSANGLRAIARREGSAQWFFVSNGADQAQSFGMSFAVTGLQPELWNAETGSISAAPVWRVVNQRTEFDLQLGSNKSIFVVFRRPVAATSYHLTAVPAPNARLVTATNGDMHWISDQATQLQLTPHNGGQQTLTLAAAERAAITGDWQVDFKPILGKPFRARFSSLSDWSTHENPEIRYFSGTATYQLRFQVRREQLADQRRLLLDLGQVRDMAEVSINDQPQGVWWHAPFERDVTAALREGENTLTIAVTNTWHNLLVGDERYPVDFEWGTDRGAQGRGIKGYPEWFVKNQPRPSAQRKAFVLWYYHRDNTALLPAGLLGPVELSSHPSLPATPR